MNLRPFDAGLCQRILVSECVDPFLKSDHKVPRGPILRRMCPESTWLFA